MAQKPGGPADPRFRAVLRIDPLLLDYPLAAKKMSEWGYDVSPDISQRTIEEARRFLRDWIDRQKAIYLAVSLPPEFRYPADPMDPIGRAGQRMLEEVVLPVCAERGLPFAMMIGSRRGVNPALQDAGDMGGKADVASVVNLCREFAGNKLMVTMLSRENQHELCVAARKFGNLMIFGCWWFLNNPSLIEEIERMRFELLGTSFIPQHSDARVIDQLALQVGTQPPDHREGACRKIHRSFRCRVACDAKGHRAGCAIVAGGEFFGVSGEIISRRFAYARPFSLRKWLNAETPRRREEKERRREKDSRTSALINSS